MLFHVNTFSLFFFFVLTTNFVPPFRDVSDRPSVVFLAPVVFTSSSRFSVTAEEKSTFRLHHFKVLLFHFNVHVLEDFIFVTCRIVFL